MNLKRLLSLLLAALLLMSLCACGETREQEAEEETPELEKGWYALVNEDELIVGYLHSTGKKLTVFDGMGKSLQQEVRFEWDSADEAFVMEGMPSFTLKESKKETELTVLKKGYLPFEPGTYTLEETEEGAIPAPDSPAPLAEETPQPETVGAAVTPDPELTAESVPEPETGEPAEPAVTEPEAAEPMPAVEAEVVIFVPGFVSEDAEMPHITAYMEELQSRSVSAAVVRVEDTQHFELELGSGVYDDKLCVDAFGAYLDILSTILSKDVPIISFTLDYLGVLNGEYGQNVSVFLPMPDYWQTADMLIGLWEAMGSEEAIAMVYTVDNAFSVYQADMLTFSLQDSTIPVALYPCSTTEEAVNAISALKKQTIVYVPECDLILYPLTEEAREDLQTQLQELVMTHCILLTGGAGTVGDGITAAQVVINTEWFGGLAADLTVGVLAGETGPWEVPLQMASQYAVNRCDGSLLEYHAITVPEGFEVFSGQGAG